MAQSSRYLTALIFPDSHLNVLAYNRCVSAWPPGLTQEAFLDQVSSVFAMEPLDSEPPLLPSSAASSLPAACNSDDVAATGRASPRSIHESRSRTVSDTTTVSATSSGELSRQQESQEQDEAQYVMHMYVGTQWYRLYAPVPGVDEFNENPLKGVGCQVLPILVFCFYTLVNSCTFLLILKQILLDKVLWPILHTDDAAAGTHMIYGTLMSYFYSDVLLFVVCHSSCIHTNLYSILLLLSLTLSFSVFIFFYFLLFLFFSPSLLPLQWMVARAVPGWPRRFSRAMLWWAFWSAPCLPV